MPRAGSSASTLVNRKEADASSKNRAEHEIDQKEQIKRSSTLKSGRLDPAAAVGRRRHVEEETARLARRLVTCQSRQEEAEKQLENFVKLYHDLEQLCKEKDYKLDLLNR